MGEVVHLPAPIGHNGGPRLVDVPPAFKWTEDQAAALTLLSGQPRHTMLYGGARSGKTFVLVTAVIHRAIKAPGSRHAIFRHRFNHLKTSIGLDTLPKVMALRFPGVPYKIDKTDWVVRIGTSEIWLGGLDDKERTEKILGQEYCVDPSSKILTADLRWVPADQIRVGQEIVGFPEDLEGHCTLQRSTVERADVIQAEKFRIVTDRGETVVSANHKFVAHYDDRRHRNFRMFSWRSANELAVGDKIRFAAAPWDTGQSYDDGWLAGMFDGEGWLSVPAGACGVAQNPGPVLERLKTLLAERGIDYREHKGTRGTSKLNLSGLWASLKLLGSVRPTRLAVRAHEIWEGTRAFIKKSNGQHVATILRIEPLGVGPVIAFGTSTKTLIADGFLGHNCTIYFNECSQIAYSAVLMARTRLAQKTTLVNRAYYDCNPPGSKHWTAMLFVGKKDPASKPAGGPLSHADNFTAMIMNPDGNRANLSPEFIAELESLPERQRNRFLLGKFTAELDNALWVLESFRARLLGDPVAIAEQCETVVVSVDPSGAAGPEDKRSDEIGLTVAGKFRGEKRYVVLADATMRGSPKQWATSAIELYKRFKADRIICEKNFGGAMVKHTIATEDNNIPVKEVTASRGKSVRAEPISTLYAKGQVEHVEGLGELEDQMLNMTSAGYMGERSPDRLDSAVWGLSDLSQGKQFEILGSF